MKIDGNAPAFPRTIVAINATRLTHDMTQHDGMTIRTAIAKDMMAAIVGSRDTMSEIHDCAEDDDDAKRIACEEAVDYADALIAALKVK